MSSGDKGQIYTLEGLIAAGIMIGVLIFILQSVSIVTPQTESTMDMKLQQKASDILICLDRYNETNTSTLKVNVSGWQGRETQYLSSPDEFNPLPLDESGGDDDPEIEGMDKAIDLYMADDVLYNVDFYYYDKTIAPEGYTIKHIIKHGEPNDNSVMVKKLVTINKVDNVPASSFWATNDRYPEVVEVRLTAWYI